MTLRSSINVTSRISSILKPSLPTCITKRCLFSTTAIADAAPSFHSKNSKDSSTSTPIELGPTSLSRLREHFHRSIQDDLMYLTYSHDLNRVHQKPLPTWDENDPYTVNRPARPPKGNKPLTPLSQPRNPRNIPEIYKVEVHAMVKTAIQNKNSLLSAAMAIQAITGKKAEIKYARKSVAPWKLREGMPVACKVTLTGHDMYTFLSMLFEVVLPRSKDFAGLPKQSGDSTGNVSFGLTPAGLALFPEIENSFEMYPHLTGFNVTICTTSTKDSEARLLLSGFGAPFVKR